MLFDLPKRKVFIGFETQKQYSQSFWLFDLPKPKVFMGFETQKQYSQSFWLYVIRKHHKHTKTNPNKQVFRYFAHQNKHASTKLLPSVLVRCQVIKSSSLQGGQRQRAKPLRSAAPCKGCMACSRLFSSEVNFQPQKRVPWPYLQPPAPSALKLQAKKCSI